MGRDERSDGEHLNVALSPTFTISSEGSRMVPVQQTGIINRRNGLYVGRQRLKLGPTRGTRYYNACALNLTDTKINEYHRLLRIVAVPHYVRLSII